MRVTVLLGAGATIDIGGPSTKRITEEVIKVLSTSVESSDDKKYVLKDIHNKLKNFYGEKYVINFEEIFHTLEMLYSYDTAWGKETTKDYKSPVAAFIESNADFKENIPYLYSAQEDLLKSVAEQVSRYDEEYRSLKDTEHSWYRNFWNDSEVNWDIATLNYDTTIEESLSEYCDGFYLEKGSDYSRFYPSEFEKQKNERHTITHLHGCINYGRPMIGDKHTFEDNSHDLYKLNSYQQARQLWAGIYDKTQSGETNNISPILTGLRKLEKLSILSFQSLFISFPRFFIEKQLSFDYRIWFW